MRRTILIAAGLLIAVSLLLLPVDNAAGAPTPPLPLLPPPPLLLPAPPPVVVAPGAVEARHKGIRGKKLKKHHRTDAREQDSRHGKSRGSKHR